MYRIGVDLGGTNIKAVILDETNKIIISDSARLTQPADSRKCVNRSPDWCGGCLPQIPAFPLPGPSLQKEV